MKINSKVIAAISRTETGRKALSDRNFRVVLFACLSMGWNLLYGIFNGVLGIVYGSLWFAALSLYYGNLEILKSPTRFSQLNDFFSFLTA